MPPLSQGKRGMMGCEPCSRGRTKAIAGYVASHDSSSFLWEKNWGMHYNVAKFERLHMAALATDRVFWPSHSVEMSGLYRVSHEHDHAPADEVLWEMFPRVQTVRRKSEVYATQCGTPPQRNCRIFKRRGDELFRDSRKDAVVDSSSVCIRSRCKETLG